MEKCSFCIQSTQAIILKAKNEEERLMQMNLMMLLHALLHAQQVL